MLKISQLLLLSECIHFVQQVILVYTVILNEHFFIQSLSDASTTDIFLKTWQQKKKMLKTSNFSVCHHMFSSIQLLYFHYKREFPNVFWYNFKVVFCRFVVCRKGLMLTNVFAINIYPLTNVNILTL